MLTSLQAVRYATKTWLAPSSLDAEFRNSINVQSEEKNKIFICLKVHRWRRRSALFPNLLPSVAKEKKTTILLIPKLQMLTNNILYTLW
jgi:hypothetical protein